MNSIDNKYYQEIVPLDKLQEILESFKDYGAKSFSKSDNGYDWLEEDDSKCVVITNPYGGANLEINIGDMGEFTLYFHAQHSHYAPYQGDYDDMIEIIHEILNNKIGAGTIKDRKGKWFGSRFVKIDEVTHNPETIFDFVFEEKEFREKLTDSGYTIELVFWDPANNVTRSNP